MKITVIICAYNGEKTLKQALESLVDQHFDSAEYEVLVVDNNSSDNTRNITQTFIKQYANVNARYVLESNAGLSFARNCGINNALGEYIIFMDDDATASPSFVSGHYQIYDQFPDAISAGGKVVAQYPTGQEPKWMSKYISGVYSVCDWGDRIIPFTNKYPVGCNMSFNRKHIQSIGGFNTDIKYRSDEKYVYMLLKQKGDKIYYAPDAMCLHHIPEKRLQKKEVMNIAQIVGIGERERLKQSFIATLFKFGEYIFKYFAALVLAFAFLIKGQLLKAQYIVAVRWHVIKGFISA